MERNIILYFLANALQYFCSRNHSLFAFDEYLFKLHNFLLEKFQRELASESITNEEREERLNLARGNIFYCDTMANIAIRVFDDFTAELEKKLASARKDFMEELELPFRWDLDEQLMKIVIYGPGDKVRDEIKLLDVKLKK